MKHGGSNQVDHPSVEQSREVSDGGQVARLAAATVVAVVASDCLLSLIQEDR